MHIISELAYIFSIHVDNFFFRTIIVSLQELWPDKTQTIYKKMINGDQGEIWTSQKKNKKKNGNN